MNFLQRWVGRIFRLTDAEPFTHLYGGGTYTGKSVTPSTAIQVTTAWACVRLLAETIGSLPIEVFQRDGSNKVKDPGHWSYWMMTERPNQDMTPVEFKEAIMTNLLTHGNAYLDISDRNGVGRPASMIPLLSELMQPERLEDGTIIYRYHTKAGELVYAADDIMHFRGFGFNGRIGLSPIAYNRQALGLSMAAEEFGARFFKQGMKHSGILVSPVQLTKAQRERLRERYQSYQEGLDNAHKLLILEAAFDFKPLTIPPDQAQFLETREYQENEICRIYLVPPHMVMNLKRATFSNIEHQDLQFAKYTLRPYLTRLEERFRQLLSPAERMTTRYKFNLNAIYRADLAAQATFFSKMVQNGIMDRNECRALLDLNAREGAGELTVQSNMIDLDQLEELAMKAGSFKERLALLEKAA